MAKVPGFAKCDRCRSVGTRLNRNRHEAPTSRS